MVVVGVVVVVIVPFGSHCSFNSKKMKGNALVDAVFWRCIAPIASLCIDQSIPSFGTVSGATFEALLSRLSTCIFAIAIAIACIGV